MESRAINARQLISGVLNACLARLLACCNPVGVLTILELDKSNDYRQNDPPIKTDAVLKCSRTATVPSYTPPPAPQGLSNIANSIGTKRVMDAL